jgi:hypothetical protein
MRLQQRAYFRVMPDRFKELLRSDVIPLFHNAQKPLAHNESQCIIFFEKGLYFFFAK